MGGPKEESCRFAVLGAGPAGLGAAWALCEQGDGDEVLVIDAHDRAGGLARTEIFDGFRFDVGPHRFFTKNQEVDRLWHETLGEDFRPVHRLTRIYYKEKFFLYPVSALDALPKLGPLEAAHALASYAWAKAARRGKEAESFEDWVTSQFGAKLYRSFFKTYTEKVWGIPCREIGADWAGQRIKGLDLWGVAKNALGVMRRGRPKTLAEEFDYPTQGAGMMYERLAERLMERGVRFLWRTEIDRVEHRDGRVRAVHGSGPDGPRSVRAEAILSTIPITRFLEALDPLPDEAVRRACGRLYYRDHITVNLAVGRAGLFPDQWIYVHAPEVQLARLANYNNFSPAMSPRPDTSAISVEYFVFRSDPLWAESDAALVELAAAELGRMGLVPREAVEAGWVVRELDSYPTYFLGYAEPFAAVRAALEELENVQPAGRGGLYRYNNMDHSLYSGLLAGRNLRAAGGPRYDVWRINIDAEYHEAAERTR